MKGVTALMDWKKYEASVRDEIGVPAGDADRVQRAITNAISYVDSAIDGHTVDDTVRADCITSCAADLYNARDARLGVMDVGDGTVEPYRPSPNPIPLPPKTFGLIESLLSAFPCGYRLNL